MSKFQIIPVETGYVFQLKAANGEAIATSQVHASLKTCKHTVESLCHNAPIANLEDKTVRNIISKKYPKFELFLDENHTYQFHLKTSDTEIIAISQTYQAKASCKKGIASVKKNAPIAEILIITD